MIKTLNKEQAFELKKALDSKYGVKGSDYELFDVQVSSDEWAFFAFLPMNEKAFRAHLGAMERAQNKKTHEDYLFNMMKQACIDCLIERATKGDDFLKVIEKKPMLISSIYESIAEMSNKGINTFNWDEKKS